MLRILRTPAAVLAAALLLAPAALAQSRDEVWASDDGVVVLKRDKSFEMNVTHAETKQNVYETGRVTREERPSETQRRLSLKSSKGPVWTLNAEGDTAELRDPQDRRAATLNRD
jgi:hypothetical protein